MRGRFFSCRGDIMKQRSLFLKLLFLNFLLLAGIIGLSGWVASADANPFNKGAKLCEECHEAEFKIWKNTKHFESFRTVHREPKDKSKPSPKKILEAVEGEKRMKRNKACSLCHYTLEQKDADDKPDAGSGTSCESCHGPSSEWLEIHDNYGGKDVKRDQESADHKVKRIADSKAKGLIWPSMKYEVAENCMVCHGLAHPELTADELAKMLGAGHPINPDFELVKYSQGSVRHRYYPPNIKENAEMTPAELSREYVVGQAAALVSATNAMSKSEDPKYKAAQEQRVANAKAGLSGVPEAAGLLAAPTRENALKFAADIAGKDLSGVVKLPAKSDYK
ncbi:MAG: hypothetical protein COV66_05845 [Nitrospinae bacterium CG11_big_fil_rev_8_21_14_0_20_45_15]|nr:MAG: hypothetical protein COV66_05845 [Nitrospinae bacterium CG11_big_fil_rev_8_21_14_0_20_45_15]